jgi:hypothetical protein
VTARTHPGRCCISSLALPISPSGIFNARDMVPCIFGREDQFVEFQLQSQRVAVLRRLDQKTIRNVTIVVPVLMTSCQVSLKPNKRPVTANTRTTAAARRKVAGRPEIREVATASLANQLLFGSAAAEVEPIGRFARIKIAFR